MNASTLEDSHTIHLDLMALREALFMDSNGTTCNDRTELNSPDECLRCPMDSKRILSPLFTHRAIGWYFHLRDKHRSLRPASILVPTLSLYPSLAAITSLPSKTKGMFAIPITSSGPEFAIFCSQNEVLEAFWSGLTHGLCCKSIWNLH